MSWTRRALWAPAMMVAVATGCVRVDDVPMFTPDEEGASEPEHAGTRLGAACQSAPEAHDRAWACLMLAGFFERGEFGLARSAAKAAELQESAIDVLEASCDRGAVRDCTRAAVAIGTVIGGRSSGADGATKEAVGWMVADAERGCRGGDALGCALLGVIYEGGRGKERDEERSEGYRDQACSGGHLGSCLWLAEQAEGSERVAAYERACRGGSGFGCAAAAQHHARGVGVAASAKEAGALFQRGCELGNPAACVMGAEVIERADPAEKRGARLAWDACSMGIPDGCLLLGARIEREKGAKRAFEVYHRACELGDPRGCAAVRRVRGGRGGTEGASGELDTVSPGDASGDGEL